MESITLFKIVQFIILLTFAAFISDFRKKKGNDLSDMALIGVSLKEIKPLAELWSASNTLKSAVRSPANKHAHNRGWQRLHSIVMMGEEKVGRFCYGGEIVERGKVGIGSIS